MKLQATIRTDAQPYLSDEYSSPAGIRRKAHNKKRDASVGSFKVVAEANNWSGFKMPANFPDCHEILHIPMQAMIQTAPIPTMMIFKPSPDTIGVWLTDFLPYNSDLGDNDPALGQRIV